MSIKNDRGDDGNVTMLQLRMTITTPQDHWGFVFGGLVGSLALFWCFGHVSWMDDVWSKGKDRTVPFVWALNSSHSLRGNRCWQHPLFVSLLVSLSEPQSVSHISSFFVTSILNSHSSLFPLYIWSFFLSLLPPPPPCLFSCTSFLLSYYITSFLSTDMNVSHHIRCHLLCSSAIFSLSCLLSLHAVRSWALRNGSAWRALVVRVWRVGRRPWMTANAVPLATRWWAAQNWWAAALPKCRRAGASMIGPGLGRLWGWRASLVQLSQMVSL